MTSSATRQFGDRHRDPHPNPLPEYQERGNRGGRILELDGLRGIAAVLVLLHHYAGTHVNGLTLGNIGVRLFFVLSGYLITQILLQCRQRIHDAGSHFFATLWRFSARRMLRLAPVLYVTIAVATALNLGAARQSWRFDMVYLSNLYAILAGDHPDATGHFWTLAIEEQFYLVWPWVILLTPQRWLKPAIWAAVIAAPLFRVICFACGTHWTILTCLPLGATDCLGLGALLSIWEMHGQVGAIRAMERVGLAAGLPLAIAGLVLRTNTKIHFPGVFYHQVIIDSAWAISGFAVISLALRYRPRLLRLRPLVDLGVISYGMYVIHLPLKSLYDHYVVAWWPALPREGSWRYTALLCAGAIVVAAISWHLLEKPIGRLKRYLPYPGERTA